MTEFISSCIGCGEIFTGDLRLSPCDKCNSTRFSTHTDSWLRQKTVTNTEKVSQLGQEIMSTLKVKKSEVDIIQPTVLKNYSQKRGPKFQTLPDGFIRELASEGLGAKAITTQLKDRGYSVSYKTIQRRLAGMVN